MRVVSMTLALLALLASASLASPSAPAPAAEAGDRLGRGWAVVTRTAAVVRADKVTLGDIAEPFGEFPAPTWERIKGLELFAAPEKGRQLVVNPDQLRAAMVAALGETGADVVSVRGGLTLQRGGFVITGNDIRGQLVAFLTERVLRVAETGAEPAVRDLAVPESIFLPEDFSRLEIEEPKALRPGKVHLKLRALTADGRVLRAVTASAFLDLWAAVPCAARPINTGETVTPEMIAHERKNLAYLRGEPARIQVGARARRPLGQGQPVYADDLEALPVVVKGATVQLLYEGSTVRLAIDAQALADGRFGDVIPVRNLQSGAQVQATVVGESTVAVR